MFGDTNGTNVREVKAIPDWIYQELTSQMPDIPPSQAKLLNYEESWLSPAAFHRIWHREREVSTRFCLEIDIIEHQKV